MAASLDLETEDNVLLQIGQYAFGYGTFVTLSV
jgi:hypothetical protein